MKREIIKKPIRLGDVSPSNPPRKSSWERVEAGYKEMMNIEDFCQGILLMEGGEKFCLPPLLPHEGNHRIAKLFEVFGENFVVELEVFRALPNDDLTGFIRGHERCIQEGIKNYQDFLEAAKVGNWERTI